MIKKQDSSKSWRDCRCILEDDNQIIFSSSGLLHLLNAFSDLIFFFFFFLQYQYIYTAQLPAVAGLRNNSVSLCKCSNCYKDNKRLLKLQAQNLLLFNWRSCLKNHTCMLTPRWQLAVLHYPFTYILHSFLECLKKLDTFCIQFCRQY